MAVERSGLWAPASKYFCKFYNLNLEINLTIGQIKGWKSKIYVTAVLDSFQDRKGITLKEVNNKQVIGLYNKGGHEGDTPSPLARVSFSHRSIFESMWLSCACYGGHQDVIVLFFFQAFAVAQILWRCPCLSKWVQGVFNWLYKKPMAAVFLQAYGLPTKILLLPLVTNMISATSV